MSLPVSSSALKRSLRYLTLMQVFTCFSWIGRTSFGGSLRASWEPFAHLSTSSHILLSCDLFHLISNNRPLASLLFQPVLEEQASSLFGFPIWLSCFAAHLLLLQSFVCLPWRSFWSCYFSRLLWFYSLTSFTSLTSLALRSFTKSNAIFCPNF